MDTDAVNASADETPHERLDRIVEAFRGKERFLVQTHNNPDPDSIASAMAVRYLVQRYTGRDAVIAFGGVVGRSENRAMVRHLDVGMVPGSLVAYESYDFTAVCDTQPGTNYTSFPENFVPTVVIDHHHPVRELTKQAEVAIVLPGYGATSSIMGEMLLARDLPIPTDVATALFYGIKSETQDLCRDTSPVDEETYRGLLKFADRRLVARIENEKVPRGYFREIRNTLERAQVYAGKAVAAHLGPVSVPDMVAEMADYLLKLQGARWSAVMGEYQQTLYISLRTDDEDADAGTVLKDLLATIGSGGGHPSMAGGQVPLGAFTETEKQAAVDDLIARWIDEIGFADEDPVALIEDDDDH